MVTYPTAVASTDLYVCCGLKLKVYSLQSKMEGGGARAWPCAILYLDLPLFMHGHCVLLDLFFRFI